MTRHISYLLLTLLTAVLLVGCSQATAAPSATTAGSSKGTEPTRVAEPTKTAVEPSKSTAVPTNRVDFPAKGKAISILVGRPPGGSSDIGARILAAAMEKELGTPVEVVNKPGANTQVALNELVKAKPDGYTLVLAPLPTTNLIYLDPRRKAGFDRTAFQSIGQHYTDSVTVAVKADSPYKTMRDLIEAAKASPDTIKASTSGIGSVPHVGLLETERVTGVKFRSVHFDGTAPAMASLLGGHTDVDFTHMAAYLPHVKSGAVRFLGLTSREESKLAPGVKTMEAQGYPIYTSLNMGIAAPAGTPKDVVGVLTDAMKRSMETEDQKKKMEETGQLLQYMGPEEFGAIWAQTDTKLQPLLSALLAEN
ncbi:MAG: tripartite tricarboxylate transporter substrate binding protein [Chloroflexota bacterium]